MPPHAPRLRHLFVALASVAFVLAGTDSVLATPPTEPPAPTEPTTTTPPEPTEPAAPETPAPTEPAATEPAFATTEPSEPTTEPAVATTEAAEPTMPASSAAPDPASLPTVAFELTNTIGGETEAGRGVVAPGATFGYRFVTSCSGGGHGCAGLTIVDTFPADLVVDEETLPDDIDGVRDVTWPRNRHAHRGLRPAAGRPVWPDRDGDRRKRRLHRRRDLACRHDPR